MTTPNPCRCETCDRSIGKPNGTDDCPLGIPSHLDIAVVDCISEIGCLSHPLAREYLNKEVIEELEQRRDNQKDTLTGNSLGFAYNEVLELIKNGVKPK